MILFERRASGILYNLLRSLPGELPFLLPANVCPVVPLTFRKAGREFRLVDLDAEDLGMDQRRCLELLSRSPQDWAGVLYVRPYGAMVDGPEGFFRALKDLRHGFLVIDDRCLCLPDCDGQRLAPSADVTLFSTGDRKPVDLGIGGFAHCRAGVIYRQHAVPYSEGGRAAVHLARRSGGLARPFGAFIRLGRLPLQDSPGAAGDRETPASAECPLRQVPAGRNPAAGPLPRLAFSHSRT
jgi:hypothetical protein